MLGHRQARQAGDTLVEVLFAVTVFSLVVVTSLSLMNQGTAAATRSLEITLVRQEMDSQAETLRFLNSAYVAAYYPGYVPAPASPAGEYYKIKTQVETQRLAGVTSVSQFGGSGTCQAAPNNSFILNTRTATYQLNTPSNTAAADAFPELVYDAGNVVTSARGIWVEAVRAAPTDGTTYTDFHIRACWYPPGGDQALNLGTIVRLYEPTN